MKFSVVVCLALGFVVGSALPAMAVQAPIENSDNPIAILRAQPDFKKPQVKVRIRFVTVDEKTRDQIYGQLGTKRVTTKIEPNSVTASNRSADDSVKAGNSSKDVITLSSLVSTCVIDQSTVDSIMKLAKSKVTSTVSSAPSVNLFDGQPSKSEDTTARPFVTSLSAVSGVNGATAIQPKVETFSEGVVINLTANFSTPSKIELSSSLKFSQIMGVKTEKVYGLPSDNAFIQVPMHHSKTVETKQEIKLGEALLIDPYFVRISQVRTELDRPLLNKIPVVNKIGNNPKVETIKRRMMILLEPVSVNTRVATVAQKEKLLLTVTPRVIIQEEEEPIQIGNQNN